MYARFGNMAIRKNDRIKKITQKGFESVKRIKSEHFFYKNFQYQSKSQQLIKEKKGKAITN